MDIGALFLILAIVVLVSVFISRPFFEVRPTQFPSDEKEYDEAEHKRSILLAEYDRVLTSMQELDFDHSLNKIPEDEYPLQRSSLLQDAADMLVQLDAMQEEADQATLEDRIETAIQNRRLESVVDTPYDMAHQPSPTIPGDKVDIKGEDDNAIETLIAVHKGKRQDQGEWLLPSMRTTSSKRRKLLPKMRRFPIIV